MRGATVRPKEGASGYAVNGMSKFSREAAHGGACGGASALIEPDYRPSPVVRQHLAQERLVVRKLEEKLRSTRDSAKRTEIETLIRIRLASIVELQRVDPT
jgi:hypothetical protein